MSFTLNLVQFFVTAALWLAASTTVSAAPLTCRSTQLVLTSLKDFETTHLKRLVTSRGFDEALRREAAADVPTTCSDIHEKLLEMTARWSALSAEKNTQHPAVQPLVNSNVDFQIHLKAVKAHLVSFLYEQGKTEVSLVFFISLSDCYDWTKISHNIPKLKFECSFKSLNNGLLYGCRFVLWPVTLLLFLFVSSFVCL